MTSFTGRARRRTTTRAVRTAERAAKALITVGGLGTIVAVTTICAFLVWVAVPLFEGATTGEPAVQGGPAALQQGAPLHLEIDATGRLAWALLPGGRLVAFRLDDGSELEHREPFAGGAPTALHVGPRPGALGVGFADGSVQLGRVGFVDRAPEAGELTEALAALPPGGCATLGRGLLVRGPDGTLRVHELDVELDPPVMAGSAAPVVLLTHVAAESQTLLTMLKQDGSLLRSVVRRRTNFMTGETTSVTTDLVLPWEPRSVPPVHLLQSDLADNVFLAWGDGRLQRIDATEPKAARVAEMVDLVPPGRTLTSLALMVGSTTLLAGDSAGGLHAWFVARDGEPELVLGHDLPDEGSPVTALAISQRNRIVASGHADGRVRLSHVTSARVLAELSCEGEPVRALALAPSVDLLLAAGPRQMRAWPVDAPHPETTPATLFLPVWYEGLPTPAHVWQSSGGSDDFEPKLGLWPLVFGTLKASVYSLLFAVPIALLAAVYTSEFLSRRWRSRVKPAIEMMASLPSVVLGFLAAIVVAPLIEGVVPATLAAFVCVPLVLVAGAHVWQLLPQQRALRLAGWPRFLCMALTVIVGLWLASAAGPSLERAYFGGDIKAWLDGRVGRSTGGWLVLLVPVAVLIVAIVRTRLVSPAVRRLTASWSRERCAAFDLLLFAGAALAVFAVARGFAGALDGVGLDPRGGLFSTYMQRNAMVVGFLTGFAVVPIVYTLAEDALSAVPDHLRAASLAAGATPWQTAVRVVVPTAMSGLFSAVMIGVGRVVGETMIVLMAAGNTPVLDLNIFNGFRTLSATIAVELPEAVQHGTLYRVLFLAALVLFAMTFVVNTIAEVVRQRFRRRAYEL